MRIRTSSPSGPARDGRPISDPAKETHDEAGGIGDKPPAVSERNWILVNLGRHEEAIEAITRSRGVSATSALDLLLLGRILVSQGREWSALEPLQSAAANLPGSEVAWMRLALALQRVGDEPGARKAMSRAVLLATGMSTDGPAAPDPGP